MKTSTPISRTSICLIASTILIGCAVPAYTQDAMVDIDSTFAKIPENERLHWYEEVDLKPALEVFHLSGKGVHITIMGEMVDATHPEIAAAVEKQYNTYAMAGEVVSGEGNLPFREKLLKHGDGHGTHIAGIIAAACDGKGIIGIACGATLDAYSIMPYDDSDAYRIDPAPSDGSGFIDAITTAMLDVTARGKSKIVTGSFNFEAPAIFFADKTPVNPETIGEISDSSGFWLEKTLNGPVFSSASPEDREMLARVIRANDKDMDIAAMSLMPRVEAFNRMAEAFGTYQKSGGVYIVTESNYLFEDRSSVFNALPTLSDKVDPDLWLSVVMVQPEAIDTAQNAEDMEAARNGRYIAPINGCGTMAKDYCIVVPSYDVLSTMTARVSEEDMPLFKLDGMTYQMFSGHSMGAPMVAGALALMQEYNKRERLGLSMKDLVRVLKKSANRDFKGYNPIYMGVGMLDVAAAIKALKPL